MKKIYMLYMIMITVAVFAQDSNLYYSGIFFNHKGKPQNFLKVFNKNSGIYEMTDEKGFAINLSSINKIQLIVWFSMFRILEMVF